MAATVAGPLPTWLTQTAFDPRRPGATLWPLVNFLEDALSRAPSGVSRFPCTPEADGLWGAALEPWPTMANPSWFLQITLENVGGTGNGTYERAREATAAAWANMAKVAAPSEMTRLVRAALPGLRRTVAQLPHGGPPPPQVLLFALEGDASTWAPVREAGRLVILPPGSGGPAARAEVLCVQMEAT